MSIEERIREMELFTRDVNIALRGRTASAMTVARTAQSEVADLRIRLVKRLDALGERLTDMGREVDGLSARLGKEIGEVKVNTTEQGFELTDRLEELEERIGKLEEQASTFENVKVAVANMEASSEHSRTAPKPASTLVTQVRDAIQQNPSDRTTHAIRAVADWLDAEAERDLSRESFYIAERYARTAKHVRAQLEP